MRLIWISIWNAIFRLEQRQPQDVCAVIWMIRRLSIKKAVNFSNIYVKLLTRMTSRRCGVMLNLNWLVANQEGKLPNAVVGSS